MDNKIKLYIFTYAHLEYIYVFIFKRSNQQ